MRFQYAITVFALGLGLAVCALAILLNFVTPVVGAPVGLIIAVVFATVLVTGGSAMEGVREFVKQIAIWAAIVALLPLTAWYGTSAFSPPPEWKQHSKATSRLEDRIRDSKEEAQKEKLRQEKDRLDQELEEAERVYYGHMFWVAYPIGLVAIILGTFYPVQSVGAGLMFGGLGSLTAGCYSYWDHMSGWLRFGSLVIALVVVLFLGTWKFRAVRPAP